MVTETDILVHVKTTEGETIQTTMFHPFYVENPDSGSGEWKAASNLLAGDEPRSDDGRAVYVESVRIEKPAEKIPVYNLEVEDEHVYYVGSGVLVHNLCNASKTVDVEGKK